MNISKSFIVTVVALVLVGGYIWHRWYEMTHAPMMVVHGLEPATPILKDSEAVVNRRMRLGRPPFPTNDTAPNPSPGANQVPYDPKGLKDEN